MKLYSDDEPSMKQATESDGAGLWKKAIQEKLTALEKMGSWEIVDRPQKKGFYSQNLS